MKLSATFLDAIEKENEGGSSKENYLRYTKLTQGLTLRQLCVTQIVLF